MLFPLVVHCLDIFSSTIGMFFVRTTPGLPGYFLILNIFLRYDSIYGALEDPAAIMKRAYKISMMVGLIGFFLICH
jgi:hypothetical protein